MSDATRAALHGQVSLSARIPGMDVANPYPPTDAADTSSFTLSRQRENIAGVEVGRGTDFSLWLVVVHRLKSMLQRLPAGET